jgi:RHS repeat-associated protein
MLAAPWTKPVGEAEKVLLVDLAEDGDHGRLDQFIFDSRDRQYTGNGYRLQAFYTFSIASGPDTVTGTFSGSGATYIQETLAEYSNVGALDVHAENSGGNSQPSTTTTTTASSDLVIGYVTDSYTHWTGETGWNLRTTGSGIRAALQDTIAANPGSVTSTFNTVNGWDAGIVAFKPTSSGPLTDKGVLNWNANGTLQQLAITDPFNSTNTQTCNFAYDDLARQSTANCGTVWNQTFSFDAFGNISKSATAGIIFNATYSSATNRITTIGSLVPTYDANGNLTNDTAHAYTWDAEGRMLTVDSGTSGGVCDTYDALGRMVEKATGTSCTSSYTEIVYAPSGARLATMTAQTLQQASVPLIGGSEAVYNSSGLLAYRHSDHLGSSRFASTPSRTKYFDVAYAPYGEDYADSGTTDLSFTGQKKDTASWLYDFMFRKYNPNHGRWMSPDPAGSAAVSLTNPQSWNRYAYVRNDPLSNVDPLGLLDDPSCKVNDIGCGGMDSGSMGGWNFGAGGGRGGAGIDACGVDIFCIQNGGIGLFGSPVAQINCEHHPCMTGSWVYSQYNVGGAISVDWNAQWEAQRDKELKKLEGELSSHYGPNSATVFDFTTIVFSVDVPSPFTVTQVKFAGYLWCGQTDCSYSSSQSMALIAGPVVIDNQIYFTVMARPGSVGFMTLDYDLTVHHDTNGYWEGVSWHGAHSLGPIQLTALNKNS